MERLGEVALTSCGATATVLEALGELSGSLTRLTLANRAGLSPFLPKPIYVEVGSPMAFSCQHLPGRSWIDSPGCVHCPTGAIAMHTHIGSRHLLGVHGGT